MRHSHGPRPSSQSWRLPSHRSISPACALRSRRRRCFGGRRRRTAGTPPARNTRRTVRTEIRSGGCSSASFSVKCASLKSRYFVRRRRRIRFRTAARSLFTGTCPALPCCSPARPARSTARRMRRTCRTESRSTRAASCSVSFPAPNRATASHRFHCHSAIRSIPLHGRRGGHNRWPLEGGQNRCPSTVLAFPVDRSPVLVGGCVVPGGLKTTRRRLLALAFSLGATPGFSWPGDLDPTFGNRGKVVSDLGALEEANAAVLQADGRIVVAGRSGSSLPDAKLALARYEPDGTLDPLFGTGGKVLSTIG